MNLRVSASDIDSFRYYRESEGMDLTAFLDRMRRKEPPTPAMLAGAALHKALESAEPGDYGALKADGYSFDIQADAEVDLPDIRERKSARDYIVGDCAVTLVGKVDAIRGRRIDDHKFTARFDAERFLSSYQWRIYLEIFGAYEFRWNVFAGREVEPNRYVISAIHPLRTFRYPGMGEDVARELALFVDFIRGHLPERIAA